MYIYIYICCHIVIYVYMSLYVYIWMYVCSQVELIRLCPLRLLKRKLDGNNIRSLLAVSNKSLKQHLTKCQLYGHLPLISQNI